jgi:hypothetical protein
VQIAGSWSASPLTVLVVDEKGAPVSGATVSLRLPDHDATGLFSNGLRSEIVLTGGDGRAAVPGIQWGAAAGPCQIRITALKGTARAGTVATMEITAPAAGRQAGTLSGGDAVPIYRPPSRWRSRWTVVALAAAGAIGGGLVVKYSQPASGPAGAIAAPAGITSSTLQIGPPVVVVTRP